MSSGLSCLRQAGAAEVLQVLRAPASALLRGTLFLCVVLAAVTVVLHVLPKVAGLEVMVVTSGSMAPAFDAGDALLVEPSAAPSTGDIIVFSTRERGSARAHRVVATIDVDGTPYLRTKGDANASPDADLLPSDAVYGSVRASMPFAGRGLALLGDPVFGMLVFILPIVWLALRELIDALALEDMW